MDQGQQRFYDFIMERVEGAKQKVAEALLNESFSKQADGTFDSEYLKDFNPRLLALIKPDCVDEVSKIMNGFSAH